MEVKTGDLSRFGWLDFSAADMRRTREALSMISSGSIDELGISILQNGFADELFPGLNVAQTSAKYFLLIPVMLEQIEREDKEIRQEAQKENNLNTLFRLLRTKLIRKECEFCDAACRHASDKTGIIGVDSAKETSVVGENYEDRMGRFPHDIYWHGLFCFGLVRESSMSEYVRSMKERLSEENKHQEDYWKDLFRTEKSLSLDRDGVWNSKDTADPLALSENERAFLEQKIRTAVQGKNTLLEEALNGVFTKTKDVYEIAENLMKSSRETAHDAAKFTLYMQCAFWGFNMAGYRNDHDKAEDFFEKIKEMKKYLEENEYGKVFDMKFLNRIAGKYGYDSKKGHVFKEMLSFFEILNGDLPDKSKEDIVNSMIQWEEMAKGAKASLKKGFSDQEKRFQGMSDLDFRLSTALRLFGKNERKSHE